MLFELLFINIVLTMQTRNVRYSFRKTQLSKSYLIMSLCYDNRNCMAKSC